MLHAIEILPSAIKELAALPRRDQEGIAKAIDHLAQNPFPTGAKKLQGTGKPPCWRIRCGDYRILYQVEKQEVRVLVVKIAHRKEAYRRK